MCQALSYSICMLVICPHDSPAAAGMGHGGSGHVHEAAVGCTGLLHAAPTC